MKSMSSKLRDGFLRQSKSNVTDVSGTSSNDLSPVRSSSASSWLSYKSQTPNSGIYGRTMANLGEQKLEELGVAFKSQEKFRAYRFPASADRVIYWAPDALEQRLSWQFPRGGYEVNYSQLGSDHRPVTLEAVLRVSTDPHAPEANCDAQPAAYVSCVDSQLPGSFQERPSWSGDKSAPGTQATVTAPCEPEAFAAQASNGSRPSFIWPSPTREEFEDALRTNPTLRANFAEISMEDGCDSDPDPDAAESEPYDATDSCQSDSPVRAHSRHWTANSDSGMDSAPITPGGAAESYARRPHLSVASKSSFDSPEQQKLF